MTMASVKRSFPRLISQARKDLRKDFNKKPTLIFSKIGRPRNETPKGWNGRSRIIITTHMAKTSPALSKVCVLHELREVLLIENGVSRSKAHRIAKQYEKKDRERLHLNKSPGWLLHNYYEGS